MNYPQLVDFGLCPVLEPTSVTFDLSNTTGFDTNVQLVVPPDVDTLTIEPQSCTISNGKIKTFRATFLPTEAVVLDCSVKVLFNDKEIAIPFKAFGKYPFIISSLLSIPFGEVLILFRYVFICFLLW